MFRYYAKYGSGPKRSTLVAGAGADELRGICAAGESVKKAWHLGDCNEGDCLLSKRVAFLVTGYNLQAHLPCRQKGEQIEQMKEFWNQRYQQEEYVYGVEPNEFFKVQIEELIPGRMLLPAEGEGRNAVFAASLGWRVHAFDQSEVAKEKALALGASKGVQIKYEISTFEALQVGERRYDVIALIYAHMPSRIRREFHQQLSQLLNKGGMIILEAFSKEQLQNHSGGPKNEDMLYDAVELREDFQDLNLDYFSGSDIELAEGKDHRGKASVIRMIMRKK